MKKKVIEKINNNCPYDQGIFVQPYGIPVHIKETVIYMRYETGGVSGGSCWDSSDPQPYSSNEPKPKFKVLDLVLRELKPDLTYLQFRELEDLVHTNEETQYEYYGNSTDYGIEYIVLSQLEAAIEKL